MLNSLLNVLREKLHRRYGPDIPTALDRLRRNGFSPEQVFDVGAYRGDFAKLCREVWPKARLTCFEVLPHRVKELKAWSAADGNTEVVECLLGAEIRSAVAFNVNETASSVLNDTVPGAAPKNFYPMRTVDEVIASSKARPPEFLKLDVQGYEYEVLSGAKKTLQDVEVILAEVNMLDLYKGARLVDELIALLRQNGFITYDICGFHRRPLDEALFQADFMFVPIESQLRVDKRWSG